MKNILMFEEFYFFEPNDRNGKSNNNGKVIMLKVDELPIDKLYEGCTFFLKTSNGFYIEFYSNDIESFEIYTDDEYKNNVLEPLKGREFKNLLSENNGEVNFKIIEDFMVDLIDKDKLEEIGHITDINFVE
jgi:hypothetical protein